MNVIRFEAIVWIFIMQTYNSVSNVVSAKNAHSELANAQQLCVQALPIWRVVCVKLAAVLGNVESAEQSGIKFACLQ